MKTFVCPYCGAKAEIIESARSVEHQCPNRKYAYTRMLDSEEHPA